MTEHLIANRWQCPDGTILVSKYRHDFVSHTDATTGEYCFVDGGLGYYVRVAGSLKNLCITSSDPHEVQREYFMWNARGDNGKQAPEWKALKDLTTEEIWCILRDYQEHMQEHILQLFREELKFRNQ